MVVFSSLQCQSELKYYASGDSFRIMQNVTQTANYLSGQEAGGKYLDEKYCCVQLGENKYKVTSILVLLFS